jgi:hypothetical protein
MALYLILDWKSSRARTRHRSRLAGIAGSFNAAVGEIAADLHAAASPEQRLGVLLTKWGFRLPTASAILSILYPDIFTIYDIRVCNALCLPPARRHEVVAHSLGRVPTIHRRCARRYTSRVESARPRPLALGTRQARDFAQRACRIPLNAALTLPSAKKPLRDGKPASPWSTLAGPTTSATPPSAGYRNGSGPRAGKRAARSADTCSASGDRYCVATPQVCYCRQRQNARTIMRSREKQE